MNVFKNCSRKYGLEFCLQMDYTDLAVVDL